MNGTVSDIIAKYDDTIEKTISLYKVRARQYGLDLDDIRQICRITIWGCLKHKSDSSPEFIPYIKTSMRKAIRSYIIRNSTGKSQQTIDKNTSGKFLQTSELLFKPCDETVWSSTTSSLPSFESDIVVKEFISECYKKDPLLKVILDMKFSGHIGHDIAKKENISYMTYKRRIRTLKNMYRAYFEEDNNDSQKTSAPHPKGQNR